VHLVTAADCLAFRGLCQPMITQRTWGARRAELPGVDPAELAEAVRPWFAESPRTGAEVARLVAGRFPGASHAALAGAAVSVIPLVQVPPRGTWDGTGPARLTTVGAWLGREPDPEPDAAALVLRYLRAFGPAAGADLRAWCGLTGLPAVVTRLRPQLRTFRDERGRTLLDVDDAPDTPATSLPGPDTPAPPRFLPAFDNVVLGFDDRSRIIDDAHRGQSVTGARFVLLDGRVAATWTTSGDDLTVHPLRPFTRAETDAVAAEAERLRGFLTGAAAGTARIGP